MRVRIRQVAMDLPDHTSVLAWAHVAHLAFLPRDVDGAGMLALAARSTPAYFAIAALLHWNAV
eukprot:SAG11_NODE_16620_length_542_cov_1.135440_1_plen_62_part_10